MPKGQSNVSLKSLCSEITEGSLLEAKDSYGNWYPVKVLNVDGDKVHVHFCNWSSRYDAWYPIDSSFLRVLKRNFVQGTTKQDKSDSYNRSMDKGSKGSEVCDIHFEVGSYVMAAWRNDFEYLAEVLAHRQRHGTKAEYRLRYIWDRVIEWTPINRLRKATQYEVDYVLKFCKEHNTSTNRLPNQPDSQQSCSSGDSEIGIPRTKRIRTTLSESKSDRSSDPELPRYRSRSTRASTSSSCIVDDKKSPHPTLYDGIVEQDGMVYEKSVFQFHEACRKRRELKRKDIEEKGAFPHSFDRSVSMDQTDHQVTLNPVPPEVSASGSLKAEDCVSKSTINVSSLSSSIPPYQKSDEVDETKSAEKACRTSVDSSNSLKSSTKCDVKNIQRTRRHLAQKKEVEIKVPHVNTSPEITSKIPPKSAAPVVYPCPYCSRQLRNSKLLDAHIVNYHKSVSNSTKSASFRGNGVYQNRCLSWKSHPNFSPFFRQISKGKLSESCSDASSVTKFTRLLSCYRCNSRAYVTEKESDLIQCSHCFCWLHRSCYGLPFCSKSPLEIDVSTVEKPHSSFVCDACRMVLRSARRSRKNEWRTGLLRSHYGSEFTKRGLLTEVSSILNKTSELRLLIASGWHILNKSNLSSLDQIKQERVSVYKSPYQEPSKINEFKTSQLMENIKHAPCDMRTTEDQVNRLYMELRGIAFGNLPEVNSEISVSKSDNLQLPNDNHTFSISTPDSECPNTNWPLDETVNNSVQPESLSYQVNDSTYNIGSQDLSGFLQDLGPDIIPEIASFSIDGVVNGGSNTTDSSAVDEFLKVPKAYTDQSPHSNENSFKDTSGCQFLSLHTSGSNPSDKDLGVMFDASDLVEHSRNSLKSCSITPCNNQLESSQQLPIGNSGNLGQFSSDRSAIPSSANAEAQPLNSDGGESIIESDPRISTNPLETGMGSDIINLPIPNCARSIISDLLKTPLNEEFATSCAGQQSDSKESTSILPVPCVSSEFTHLPSTSGLNSLDIDWLETDTQGHSVNSSSPVYQNDVKIYDHPNLHDFSDLSNHVPDFSSQTFGLSPKQLEKLAQTQNDLVHLDEYILTPFENALSVMEAQLDVITERVTNFERLHKHDPCNSPYSEHHIFEDNKKFSNAKYQENNDICTSTGLTHSSQLSNSMCMALPLRKMNDKYSSAPVVDTTEYKEFKLDGVETYLKDARTAAQHLYRMKNASSQASNLNNVKNTLTKPHISANHNLTGLSSSAVTMCNKSMNINPSSSSSFRKNVK